MLASLGSLLVLVLAGLALTVSLRGAETHQVFTEGMVAAVGPSPLSPLLSPDDPVAQAVGALSEPGLMAAGRSGAARLGLATSWRALEGGQRYRFTLSPSRRWSDGLPVTTKDVAFTLAVLQSPRFPDRDLAAPWTGVSLYAASLWSGTFVLPGPSPTFATAAEVPVLPAAHYASTVSDYLRGGQREDSLFPPSAGPFHLAANGPDQVALARNPYFRPQPRLSGFDIQLEPSATAVQQLLGQGRLDGWLAAAPSDLSGLPAGLTEVRITTYAFVELLLNEQSSPLDELPVRYAVAAAVDRESLVRGTLAGLGKAQYGPLPDSIAWARGVGSTRQLAATRSASVADLLRPDGWSRPAGSHLWERDGRPLRLEIDVPDLAPLPQAAAAVATELEAEGMVVRVRTLGAGDFVSGTLSSEDFQAALVGFDNGPDPDLTSLWASGVEPGQSLNFSQSAQDPFLNHALDALAAASSPADRLSAYREVAKRLAVDMPAVFLYTPVDVYVHLGSVHTPGIPSAGDPDQRFRDVVDWSL